MSKESVRYDAMHRGGAQQKDMFSKRWRQVKAPQPSELQLQIALIQHLHYRCHKHVTYWHVPNGEARDKATAAKLKAMGVLPGVSDLVFVWCQPPPFGLLRNLYLELKAPGGTMSPEQNLFADRMINAGAFYEHANSIDAALAILQQYGILK